MLKFITKKSFSWLDVVLICISALVMRDSGIVAGLVFIVAAALLAVVLTHFANRKNRTAGQEKLP